MAYQRVLRFPAVGQENFSLGGVEHERVNNFRRDLIEGILRHGQNPTLGNIISAARNAAKKHIDGMGVEGVRYALMHKTGGHLTRVHLMGAYNERFGSGRGAVQLVDRVRDKMPEIERNLQRTFTEHRARNPSGEITVRASPQERRSGDDRRRQEERPANRLDELPPAVRAQAIRILRRAVTTHVRDDAAVQDRQESGIEEVPRIFLPKFPIESADVNDLARTLNQAARRHLDHLSPDQLSALIAGDSVHRQLLIDLKRSVQDARRKGIELSEIQGGVNALDRLQKERHREIDRRTALVISATLGAMRVALSEARRDPFNR